MFDFGVVDIVVPGAGLQFFKTLEGRPQERNWDILQKFLWKSQFELVNKQSAIMRQQGAWRRFVRHSQ